MSADNVLIVTKDNNNYYVCDVSMTHLFEDNVKTNDQMREWCLKHYPGGETLQTLDQVYKYVGDRLDNSIVEYGVEFWID